MYFKNKKMCEEPCVSCGKCWTIKTCLNCNHKYNKPKCRYSDEELTKARKKYSEIYERYFKIALIVITIIYLLNIFSSIHFIIHAITNKDLGLGAIIIWYFGKYWWLFIVDIIFYFKIKK